MALMPRVRRLFDIEIDEISVVDRPANQHGVVAITKRHQEEHMPEIYTADGTPVDEEDLAHGDVVYDDDGQEYVFVEEADEGEDDPQHYDNELVGKGFTAGPAGVVRSTGNELVHVVGRGRNYRASTAARQTGERARRGTRNLFGDRRFQVGGTAVGAGGLGYAGGRGRREEASKGLGQDVYEALSKALGQDDRDQVIAKMADEVEIYKSQAEEALEIAAALAEERELAEYAEIAKGYNLPGDPADLAVILKNAADTLPDDQLEYLDRVLSAAGEAAYYNELGTSGSMQTSDVLSQVEALAHETVGKADVSLEQATVALFDANPAAYDEYLAEQGR